MTTGLRCSRCGTAPPRGGVPCPSCGDTRLLPVRPSSPVSATSLGSPAVAEAPAAEPTPKPSLASRVFRILGIGYVLAFGFGLLGAGVYMGAWVVAGRGRLARGFAGVLMMRPPETTETQLRPFRSELDDEGEAPRVDEAD